MERSLEWIRKRLVDLHPLLRADALLVPPHDLREHVVEQPARRALPRGDRLEESKEIRKILDIWQKWGCDIWKETEQMIFLCFLFKKRNADDIYEKWGVCHMGKMG